MKPHCVVCCDLMCLAHTRLGFSTQIGVVQLKYSCFRCSEAVFVLGPEQDHFFLDQIHSGCYALPYHKTDILLT